MAMTFKDLQSRWGSIFDKETSVLTKHKEIIDKISNGGKKQLIFSLKSNDEEEKVIAEALLNFLKAMNEE